MKRAIFLPALTSALLVFGAGTVSAGTVFDFIPRMDFAPLPELVSKDKSNIVYSCKAMASDKNVCAVDLTTNTPKLSKDADK